MPGSPRHAITACVPALLALALLGPREARAEEAVLTLALSPEYTYVRPSAINTHGVGPGFFAEYGVDEYFCLRFDAGYHYLWDAATHGLHSARLGVGATYGLDATEVVPFLSVGLAGYLTLDPDAIDRYATNFGGSFGLGFDWLATDTWAVGLEARYHALFTDIERVTVTFGLRVGYRLDML